MSFGKMLQISRTNRGFTQRQLAEALGVAKSTVTSWETDARQPDISTIKKLTGILNVTAEELLEINKDPIELSEIEKAPAPEKPDAEAKVIEYINDFIKVFSSIGWLNENGDITDEQFKVLKGVVLLLSEVFGK